MAGHYVAFGCTEEDLLHKNHGCKARGLQSDEPFDHSTGLGRVHAKQGCYHDAIANKLNTVLVLISEVFGGVTPFTHSVLIRLCKEARAVRDGTRYSLMCAQSYYSHWATALSSAIVHGDAEALLDGKRRKEARHTATPAVQAQ